MTPLTIGVAGVVICLILIFLGFPIAISTAVVGGFGVLCLKGARAAWVVAYVNSFSSIADFALSTIPLFVFMGVILIECGIGDEIFTAMRQWLGHVPGGLAVATTAACAALGTCTGSSQAATAVMARMAYPEMRKYGYQPELAFGVVAASGTIAAMIPPSIEIVVYGTMAKLGVGRVLIAGFTGGIVSALIYMAMMVGRVMLNPSLAPRLPPAPWRSRFISLRYLIPPLVMLVIITGGMYKGVFTPTEAGGVGALVAFIVVLVMRRLTWSRLRKAILETCEVTVMILLMLIGVIFLTRFLIYSKVIFAFTKLALIFPNPLITLFLVLIVYIILGMFLDAMGMLMITTPILVPAIRALGYDPVWFGIIVIKMCQIAWLTPPVALNVFVTQTITEELPLERGFKAVLPFLACDILTLLLFIAFPQIILFLPNLMAG